jgi:hypothetical protein
LEADPTPHLNFWRSSTATNSIAPFLNGKVFGSDGEGCTGRKLSRPHVTISSEMVYSEPSGSRAEEWMPTERDEGVP